MSMSYVITPQNTIRVTCGDATMEFPIPPRVEPPPPDPPPPPPAPSASAGGYLPVQPFTPGAVHWRKPPPVVPRVLGIASFGEEGLTVDDFLTPPLVLELDPHWSQATMERQMRDIVGKSLAAGEVHVPVLDLCVKTGAQSAYALPDLHQFLGGEDGLKGIRIVESPSDL